jgi:hypothetical protein
MCWNKISNSNFSVPFSRFLWWWQATFITCISSYSSLVPFIMFWWLIPFSSPLEWTFILFPLLQDPTDLTMRKLLIFRWLVWRKERSLKKFHFFRARFSRERHGQPNFKFDIDSEVCFIYRLIPRKPDFLGWLLLFDTTPIGRIVWALVAFTAAYNIKVFVSGNQSIDMHCIMLPVKSDGTLSISVLRNKQLFKKMEVKSSHFQIVLMFLIFKSRHLKKGQTLEKVSLFWISFFLWTV